MQKHFEGSTKSEAVALADAWWRKQSGLTAILRVTQPMDDAQPPSRWKVVVHYRKNSPSLPLREPPDDVTATE
jgi:hypothetical protein